MGLRERLRLIVGALPVRVAPARPAASRTLDAMSRSTQRLAPRPVTVPPGWPALRSPTVRILRPGAVSAAEVDPARVIDVRDDGARDVPGVRRVSRADLAAWVASGPAAPVLLGADDLDGAAAAERCMALGLDNVAWVRDGVIGWSAAGRATGEGGCVR